MEKTLAELINMAAARGVHVGTTEAEHVLLAETVLAHNPEHENAKLVIKNFGIHLRTGQETNSFAGFMLSERDEQAKGA
jgi:hypothetical protein